jgi:hypothetical protein
MGSLELLAMRVASGRGEFTSEISVSRDLNGNVYARGCDNEWRGSVSEWQAALIVALSENVEPLYPRLTDWVRAQPSGTTLLAVFPDDGIGEFASIDRGDNDGKFLGLVHEPELVETLASGREYSAVWLSRYVDPGCESKIPRSVKVYRER